MHADLLIGPPAPGDGEDLRRLWKRVFGDPDDYIDGWFDFWYDPALTLCVRDGEPVSMGFLLDVGRFSGVPCAMIYAVATDEAYRGGGLASALVRALRETARARGFGCTVLRPAEPSLFDFYRTHTGHLPLFTAGEGVFSGAGAPGAREVGPEEYLALRETLLAGTPHVAFSRRAIEWFARSGGRLWRVGDAVCAAEEEDGRVILKELLAPPRQRESAALAAARQYGREECAARWPDPTGAPFAMADVSGPSGAWLGLAYD